MRDDFASASGWREWGMSLLFIFLTAFFLIGTLPTVVGNYTEGILVNGILDRNNFIVKADEFVNQFKKEGFAPLEISALIIPVKTIDNDALLLQEHLHRQLEEEFPEVAMMSLLNFPNPKLVDDELDTSSYLNEEVLDAIRAGKWQRAEWLAELQSKIGPRGLLYGEDQSFLRMMMVFPEDYNENAMRDRLANLLEKRNIPWYWWLWKSDITPREEFEQVKVTDWTVGRALMSAALNSNTIRMMAMGLFLAWVFSRKLLRSTRQATISSLMLLCAFIWIKGTIGWLYLIHAKVGYPVFWGYPMRERVFVLLVYAFIIIGGISFTTRFFDAFNESRRGTKDSREAFCSTRSSLGMKFLVVAVIGFSNFLSLYQIGTRAIMEVGMLCSIALVYLLFLSFKVQPAVYLVWERLRGPETLLDSGGRTLSVCEWTEQKLRSVRLDWLIKVVAVFLSMKRLNRAVDAIVTWTFLLITKKSRRRYWSLLTPLTPVKSIAIVLVALACFFSVVCLQYLGMSNREYKKLARIRIDEEPLGYMSGGNFIQGAEIVNGVKTGTAQARAPFLVLPRDTEKAFPSMNDPDYWKKMLGQVKKCSQEEDNEGWQEVEDPVFLQRVAELQKAIAKIYGVAQVWSAVDGLQDYSRALYGSDLPRSKSEAHDAFEAFRNKMEESQNGWMATTMSWFRRGIALSVFVPADSANQMKDLGDEVFRITREQFPDLIVAPFGQLHIYAQTANTTSVGKMINIVTSFGWVYGIVWVWIVWTNLGRRNDDNIVFIISPLWAGFAVALPFAFAFSVISLVMYLFKIPMDQASACATAFGVNAAIDFNVYFIDDFSRLLNQGKLPDYALKHTILTNGRPMVVDCILNSICFLPLAFSSFIPIARLGWTLSGMMLLCGFGALVLMTSALPWCVRINKC